MNLPPILAALLNSAKSKDAPFYCPGHKGRAISKLLLELSTSELWELDLPELPQFDNLCYPSGAIAESQKIAAEVFGAKQTWFLVNGSSVGLMAAILTVCKPYDEIILPRNVHQSIVAGLILSGATPIFINPAYDFINDIPHSITAKDLEITLSQHPHAKAVLIVYPTYHGIAGDILTMVEVVHQYNIPLIVDEAHGSHFRFSDQFPISALKAGADLTVQSTHKTLGSLSQSSMLHIQGSLIDPNMISKSLQILQSTSPNAILLASLDTATYQMQTEGTQLMEYALALAKQAADQIELNLLTPPDPPTSGFYNLDPTRLTVCVSEIGLTGFEADEILIEQFGVIAELPTLFNLTFIVSMGNTEIDIDRLIRGINQLPRSLKLEPLMSGLPSIPELKCTPREAFFSQSNLVLLSEGINRISAEIICPYPPGIPIIMPGELITASALEYLKAIQLQNGKITGSSDPTLTHIKVI